MNARSLRTGQFCHMAWADALALGSVIGRLEVDRDDYILGKLLHLHVVQRIFLDVLTGARLDPRVADNLALAELSAFVHEVHAGSMRFLASLTPAELERVFELPVISPVLSSENSPILHDATIPTER